MDMLSNDRNQRHEAVRERYAQSAMPVLGAMVGFESYSGRRRTFARFRSSHVEQAFAFRVAVWDGEFDVTTNRHRYQVYTSSATPGVIT